MNNNSAYPSNYIKASDYAEPKVEVLDKVLREAIGRDKEIKPCLYFQGSKTPLVLNKTNANTLVDLYGPETSDWKGKQIELFVVPVEFSGKVTDGIRMRKPSEKFIESDVDL